MAENFHIARTEYLPDPQRTNLWTVEILPPKLINDAHKALFSNKLKFRCSSVSIPNRKLGFATSNVLGKKISFPLTSDEGDKRLRMKFVEREDHFVAIGLNSWLHEVYDSSVLRNDEYDKSGSFKKDFWTNIRIWQYGLNGELLPSYISVHHAIIETLTPPELRYDSCNAMEYEATFAFDYWHIMGSGIAGYTADAELMTLTLP